MSDEENSNEVPQMDQGDENSADFEERNEAHLRGLYEVSSDEDGGWEKDRDVERTVELFDKGKVVIVNRPFVADLLENDRSQRKARSFPLVSFTQMQIMSQHVRFELGSDLLSDENQWRDEGGNHSKFTSDYEENTIEILCDLFSEMNNILKLGEGHLVAAGGAVTSVLVDYSRPSKDCDFFFHGIDTEKAEAIVQKIIKWWLDKNITEDDDYRAYRNAHCTTLFNGTSGARYGDTYQLIHRCYKSPDEVIGGFDLGPCSVLYDGNHIWATEMGAFSLTSRLMVVDVSRRSKSFGQRIAKYGRKGFRPVFLTKPLDEIKKLFPLTGNQSYRTVQIGDQVRFVIKAFTAVANSPLRGYAEERSDYDSGQDWNSHNMAFANTLMAVRDKPEMVCWGGNKWEDVVGDDVTTPMLPNCTNPNAPIVGDKYSSLSYFYWSQHFPHLSIQGQKEALHRWFGEEFREWRNAEFKRLFEENGGEISYDDDTEAAKIVYGKTEDVVFYQHFLSNEKILMLGDKATIGFARAAPLKGKPIWLGMGDNPTRQLLTSSIHPVLETMSFYNPLIKNPLCIGVPLEICGLLYVGKKDPQSTLHVLNMDCLREIIKTLRRLLVCSPVRNLLDSL